MRKIIRIIFVLIISIMIIINLLSVLNLSFLGIRVFRVGSGSMNPYLKVNDLIIIKKSDDYNINEVVTYKNEKDYITHRIIEKDGEFITTKGDANNTQDAKITQSDIVGKVIFKFRINLLILIPAYIALIIIINLYDAKKQKGKHSIKKGEK